MERAKMPDAKEEKRDKVPVNGLMKSDIFRVLRYIRNMGPELRDVYVAISRAMASVVDYITLNLELSNSIRDKTKYLLLMGYSLLDIKEAMASQEIEELVIEDKGLEKMVKGLERAGASKGKQLSAKKLTSIVYGLQKEFEKIELELEEIGMKEVLDRYMKNRLRS